jgi:hypothetical protein
LIEFMTALQALQAALPWTPWTAETALPWPAEAGPEAAILRVGGSRTSECPCPGPGASRTARLFGCREPPFFRFRKPHFPQISETAFPLYDLYVGNRLSSDVGNCLSPHPGNRPFLLLSEAALPNAHVQVQVQVQVGQCAQRHIDPSEGLSQNVNRSEKQERPSGPQNRRRGRALRLFGRRFQRWRDGGREVFLLLIYAALCY